MLKINKILHMLYATLLSYSMDIVELHKTIEQQIYQSYFENNQNLVQELITKLLNPMKEVLEQILQSNILTKDMETKYNNLESAFKLHLFKVRNLLEQNKNFCGEVVIYYYKVDCKEPVSITKNQIMENFETIRRFYKI